MTVKFTVHDGGLKRFSLRMRSVTGQGDAECIVFAKDAHDAIPIAVDKMRDKWLRHQNKRTRWFVIGKPVEC